MAFGLSTAPFLIKEGTMYIGTVTSPETIGTDAVDPLTKFTGDPLGYIRQGSINIDISREYAEALASTPGIILRKDLIRKQFRFIGELFQVNADLLALVRGLRVQASYAVTTPSAKTIDLAHIGPDEPTSASTRYAVWIQTALTNGKEFYVAMYSAQNTSEDISITLSGTDYSVSNISFEAFPHASVTADTDLYGAMWIDQT